VPTKKKGGMQLPKKQTYSNGQKRERKKTKRGQKKPSIVYSREKNWTGKESKGKRKTPEKLERKVGRDIKKGEQGKLKGAATAKSEKRSEITGGAVGWEKYKTEKTDGSVSKTTKA